MPLNKTIFFYQLYLLQIRLFSAQPPGIPEICKKSLTSCPASGGLELFVLGKNFLKDTKVFFQQFEDGRVCWEQAVVPDKEYLQQVSRVKPNERCDF